jgi:SAM-dependent methyltransferase
MRRDLLQRLRSPGDGASGATFELVCETEDGGHVMSGYLRDTDNGARHPIVRGVPQFVGAGAAGDAQAAEVQARTTVTFSDKWRRFKSYGMQPAEQAFLFEWYRKKFGLASHEALLEFYAGFASILEVGPGSGFNTRFIAEHNPNASVVALDISEAAHTTFENTRHLANCGVVQADLMAAPFADDSFDFVIADGVLHHTPDTRKAVEALYRKVRPGGRFFFYVYRRMGAVRQFTDRHVREHFTRLSPEECYQACEPITELGRALAGLKATVTLDKPIEILGIPAGTHDVQRLFYYNFIKCFWNDAFDFETNNMVNFDWYHPHAAWQHSEDEVIGWLTALGVERWTINDANPNGISVLLDKPERP